MPKPKFTELGCLFKLSLSKTACWSLGVCSTSMPHYEVGYWGPHLAFEYRSSLRDLLNRAHSYLSVERDCFPLSPRIPPFWRFRVLSLCNCPTSAFPPSASSSFLINYLEFSTWATMWIEMDSLLAFSFYKTLFISFSSFVTLARNSRTMLNRSGKSGHSCLLSDLKRKALTVMWVVGGFLFHPRIL